MGSCDGTKGGIVGHLADLRLVEQVLEPAWGDGGGHVQDRSRRRRDPDGVVGRRLRRDARAVDADAGAAASGAPGGDVDEVRLAALQAPQRRRRGVAERGAGPAREHGRHPPPAAPEHGVADGVDAVVDAVQPAGPDSVRDRLLRQPELGELARRDDAVLPARERRDRPIHRGWAEFHATVLWFSAHPPSLAGNASQRTPETQQFSATPAAEHARGRPTPRRCGRSGPAASAGRPAGYRARPWEASSSAWPPPARRTRRRASWPASSPSSRSRYTRA